MSFSMVEISPLAGERSSALFPAILLVLGLGLGIVDLQWALAPSSANGTTGPRRAVAEAAPLAPPSPRVLAPIVAPIGEAERGKDVDAGPSCPPLFSVRFSLGSVTPRFDQAALEALVAWLLAHPRATLVVDGHSDSLGGASLNLALSRQRADEMVNRLVAAKLPRERLTRRAFGDYEPVVGAAEDSAENRRVVLSVVGVKGCSSLESR